MEDRDLQPQDASKKRKGSPPISPPCLRRFSPRQEGEDDFSLRLPEIRSVQLMPCCKAHSCHGCKPRLRGSSDDSGQSHKVTLKQTWTIGHCLDEWEVPSISCCEEVSGCTLTEGQQFALTQQSLTEPCHRCSTASLPRTLHISAFLPVAMTCTAHASSTIIATATQASPFVTCLAGSPPNPNGSVCTRFLLFCQQRRPSAIAL
jgi:hypothetical protein